MFSDEQQFFALYYGQPVASHHDKRPEWRYKVWTIDNIHHITLKPLSSVLDEEVREAARLMCGFDLRITHRDEHFIELQSDGTTTVTLDMETCCFCWEPGEDNLKPLAAYDYLRSLGYLLPFKGYDVNQLIEMRWVTLL